MDNCSLQDTDSCLQVADSSPGTVLGLQQSYLAFVSWFSSLSVNVVEYCHKLRYWMDFSVDLSHTTEKNLNLEIVKLLESTHLSSISDINPTALQMLNKGPDPYQTFPVAWLSC